MSGDAPACPGCTRALDANWPPLCPGCWRALPDALADAVRGKAGMVLRGERPAALTAALAWLAAYRQRARALTQRLTGERDALEPGEPEA